MLEKIRRKDKVEVDMAMVGTLMKYQKDINEKLKGSGVRCNLHPKSDLEPCRSCEIFEKCRSCKKERDYIKTNQISYKSSKRRKQKESKGESKTIIMDSYEDDSAAEYPCGEFDFTCPNIESCEGGQYCPYR